MSDRRVLIIAGPNGAGKTTFARAFLPEEAHCPRFINADLIAAGLSPFDSEAAAVRAARVMLEEIDGCIARAESFAFETTLAGRAYLRRIAAWRAAGWHVTLFFLALPSVESAIDRVAERVGHHVPGAIASAFRGGPTEFRAALQGRGRRLDSPRQCRRPADASGLEEPNMIEETIEQSRNPDIANSLIALRRAARMARELAVRTNTAIVVVRDGQLVRITADELRASGVR